MKNSLTRPGAIVTAFVLIAIFAGCRRGFQSYYERAQKSYASQNDVETVDALQLGLPKWRDSDGVEMKAQAYQLLGHSYHRLRNTDKAIAAYRQAVQLSSSTFESARALGQLLLVRSQTEAAMHMFERALQMKPGDPETLLGLGNSCYMLHQNAQARQAFEQVIDNSPAVRDAMEAIKAMDAGAARSSRAPTPRARRSRR